ncbi:traub [Metarhizium album ARSEF 1941]|uniref:Protein BFR2 n=1 Tax=Metarhizium album (strain ARSEF 1941) TaxID=1081103 RepID=A0A0B2X5J6_METAS|nr:traub [Metarhizium album ARSEF 1941]KHO01654.1 traub [Metarhizium album ARSEF 1941]
MAKLKGRAKQFRDPDEVIIKDHDPEANARDGASADGSGSEDSEDENRGTGHYVSVGRSRLRHRENVSLGPEYRGSRVSRSALDDESEEDREAGEGDGDDDDDKYDDPDVADLEADEAEANDSEINSDDALGESDVERFRNYAFRGSAKPTKPRGRPGRAAAADFMSDDDENNESGEEEDVDDGLDALANGELDPEEVGDEDEEYSEDDEDGDEDEGGQDKGGDDDKDEKEQGSAKKTAARPHLSALSNRADVEKGAAIQKQREIYDGLLNLRIRLQKALVAANSFPMVETDTDAESEPYEAAEEAAVKLLDTISSLRESISASTKSGEKRKRDFSVSMSNDDIWEQLQGEDKDAIGFRQERLEKWSKKVQSVNTTRPSGIGERGKGLIGALQEQLIVPDNRLVKRTRVPRSCAPAQLARKVAMDEYVYDDADFYQLLLKELVEQRTVEGAADQATGVPTVMVTATKEAKVRKQVDRKASKGRKMRFTVHEKLQNFMAPEDRRSWEQAEIDRFFGTLFGRKLHLNEDESEDEDEDEGEEMEGVDIEDGGLKLFRN